MALPTASDNPFPSLLLTEQGSAPASPAAGKQRLYVLSSDHLAYLKNSSGTVVNLISNPMTASGDIIYGGASGVPTRLAKGSDGQVLKLASGVPSWAAAGGGTTTTGNSLFAVPPGFSLVATGTSALVASTGYMGPIVVPAPMLVRNFVAQVSSAGSGTHQWGLFDFSASATAATKLAGGTGALNSTGEVAIAASGAPVSINAGFYVLIVLAPAANAATVRIVTSTVATKMNQQSQASYAWDDTPDLTSGWGGAGSTTRMWYLTGDVVSGTQF